MRCGFLLKLCLVLSIASVGGSEAEQARKLSLEDCIAIAVEKNIGIRQLKHDLMRAEANLQVANAPYWPSADLTVDAPDYSERTDRIESPVLREIVMSAERDIWYRGSLNVSQTFPMVGKFTVSSRVYQRDLVSDFRMDRRELAADVVLRYEQSLLGLDATEQSVRRAELNLESTRRRFQRQRSTVVSQVTQAYFDLLGKIRQVQIYSETVESSKAAYDIADKKFKAGLIPEVEALRLKVDLAKNEAALSEAKLDVAGAEDVLKEVLGLDLSEEVAIDTEIRHVPVQIDLEEAIKVGLRKRAELREAEIQYQLQRMSLEETKWEGRLKGTLNGYYGLKGLGDRLEDVADTFDRNRWGMYLNFNLPLWDSGLSRARVRASQALVNNSKLDLEERRRSIVLEIKDAVRRLEEAANRIEILEASVDLARKSFEITQKRFEAGLVTSEILLDAQLALTKARTDNLDALVGYQLALAALKRATMAELEELMR